MSHQTTQDQFKICIIVPAYNESESIAKTVEEIRSLKFHPTVVVIDDGSIDQTAQKAANAGANVISLPFNLGIGGAVQTGFRFAHDYGFDIAVQVDGDGQHDVGYIQTIIQPIMDGKVDLTIGSRFLPPYLGYQSSFVRRIGINFFANLISFLSQNKITDPTSGFRAYNKKMIKLFAEYYPQDFPEPEAIVVAQRYHAKILEVAVKMRKREGGVSSIRYLRTLYYMVKVTFAILLDKLKQNKEMQ